VSSDVPCRTVPSLYNDHRTLTTEGEGQVDRMPLLKDAIHSAEPLTRTAIILASKKLAVDERKYLLQELELDRFEKLLVKYC
jgi:hypothetical protein